MAFQAERYGAVNLFAHLFFIKGVEQIDLNRQHFKLLRLLPLPLFAHQIPSYFHGKHFPAVLP